MSKTGAFSGTSQLSPLYPLLQKHSPGKLQPPLTQGDLHEAFGFKGVEHNISKPIVQFTAGVDHPAAHWSHKAPAQRGKQSQESGTLHDPMWHPALQMAMECDSKPEQRETHASNSPRPAILAYTVHKLVPLQWNCTCTHWKKGTLRSHRLDHRPLRESAKTRNIHSRVKQSAACHPSQQERTQRARENPMA